MRCKLVLLILTNLCVALPCLSQPVPTPVPQRDPQAIAILAQAHAAVSAAAGAVQDSQAEGTITWANGRSGVIILKTKGEHRLRYETTVDGQQTINIVNGRRGQTETQGGRRDARPWITAYQRAEHIPAFSRLGDFLRANMNVSLVGTADVTGRPAHQIRFTALPTDSTPREIEEIISDYYVFLDAQSLLPVKTITYDFSPEIIENRTLVETYYSDYRLVAGVPVPHRITRYVRGQQQMEIVLTSVSFNVGLPDAEFQMVPITGRRRAQ